MCSVIARQRSLAYANSSHTYTRLKFDFKWVYLLLMLHARIFFTSNTNTIIYSKRLFEKLESGGFVCVFLKYIFAPIPITVIHIYFYDSIRLKIYNS